MPECGKALPYAFGFQAQEDVENDYYSRCGITTPCP